MNKDLESIQEARDLAEAAYTAFQAFEHFTEEQVERILAQFECDDERWSAKLHAPQDYRDSVREAAVNMF